MKIQLLSDLHLEFADYRPVNKEGADVLILAGDIMVAESLKRFPNPRDDLKVDKRTSTHEIDASRYRNFMKHCAKEFPTVIAIAGNHEYYHGDLYKVPAILKQQYAEFGIHFLHDEVYHLSETLAVYGGTCWTDMNRMDPLTLHAIRDMMNDFRVIRNDRLGYSPFKPATAVELHRKFLQALKFHMSEYRQKKFIVVSHHAPSALSVHESYKNDQLMNGGYHSRLEDFILDHEQIMNWFHGHCHNYFDYELGQCRVVCNPRGYHWNHMNENVQFNESKIIEL